MRSWVEIAMCTCDFNLVFVYGTSEGRLRLWWVLVRVGGGEC